MDIILLGDELMVQEVKPEDTSRARAYSLWMKVPNPMITLLKTIKVTNIIRVSRKRHIKFNMLLCYCIGKAAARVKEFYLLPVGDKLIHYDRLAISVMVKNIRGGVNWCDIEYTDNLDVFNRNYLYYTAQAARKCKDRDLSKEYMVVGSSAVVETELDGAIGMNTGIFNNPFLIWGKYKRRLFNYYLPISLQFHHTQMDGSHAGMFLERLQRMINGLT